MALNIKNPEVDRLVTEVSQITGETKTEAIRKALLERKTRLKLKQGHAIEENDIFAALEREIWSKIPAELLGKTISKTEREEMLGYGEMGV